MPLPTITALPTPPSRSDAPAAFNASADSFLGAFPTLQSEINAFGAAIPAMVNGIDYNGTSTTSVLIGTGSKSFTTQTGKNFQIGQSVRIAYDTTPANYMDGQVTSYTSGTGALVVLVSAVGGAGTFALWTISLAVAGGSNVTLTGTETLTNKTLTTPVLSATVSGITAGRLGYTGGAVSFGDGTNQRTIASLDGVQVFTNKTIDFAVGGNVGKVNGNTLAATAGVATITLPNSTDTLVGRVTTDTLTNKTLTSPVINTPTITAGTVAISAASTAASPGFLGLPQNAKTANYTLAIGDTGYDIYISGTTAAQTITIPANASVVFPVGAFVQITNDSNQNWLIAITTDTLFWSPSAGTGTRTLAAGGQATIRKVTATRWWISGAGLT